MSPSMHISLRALIPFVNTVITAPVQGKGGLQENDQNLYTHPCSDDGAAG